MPDSGPHPQDVANLILYLQTELALLEQTGSLAPEALQHVRNCQQVMQQGIDQLELRDWYRELTHGLQDQLGRLEEWF